MIASALIDWATTGLVPALITPIVLGGGWLARRPLSRIADRFDQNLAPFPEDDE